MKMKKLVSAIASLTIAASSFAAFTISASAAEVSTTYNFDDVEASSPFTVHTNSHDSNGRVEVNKIISGSVEIGNESAGVFQFKSANNAGNSAHGAFISKSFEAPIKSAKFDFCIASDRIGIMLGNYSKFAHYVDVDSGWDGSGSGSNKKVPGAGLSSITAGVAFNVGTIRKDSSDYYAVNNTKNTDLTKNNWYHAELSFDYEMKKTTYSIYNYSSTGNYADAAAVKTSTDNFLGDAGTVDSIMLVTGASSATTYLDNLTVITDDELILPPEATIKTIPETATNKTTIYNSSATKAVTNNVGFTNLSTTKNAVSTTTFDFYLANSNSNAAVYFSGSKGSSTYVGPTLYMSASGLTAQDGRDRTITNSLDVEKWYTIVVKYASGSTGLDVTLYNDSEEQVATYTLSHRQLGSGYYRGITVNPVEKDREYKGTVYMANMYIYNDQITYKYMSEGSQFGTSTVIEGLSPSAPEGTPTKDGYTFKEWKVDDNDPTIYTAVFEENKPAVTVTFDSRAEFLAAAKDAGALEGTIRFLTSPTIENAEESITKYGFKLVNLADISIEDFEGKTDKSADGALESGDTFYYDITGITQDYEGSDIYAVPYVVFGSGAATYGNDATPFGGGDFNWDNVGEVQVLGQ